MFISSSPARIFFVFFGLFIAVECMPAFSDIKLLKYQNERNKDGSYSFNYELSDGQSRTEKGIYNDGKDANGNDIKVLSVTGQYSFVAPSGEKFVTFYAADENGYRVKKMMMTEQRATNNRLGEIEAEIKSDEDDSDNNNNDDVGVTESTTTVAETQTELAS